MVNSVSGCAIGRGETCEITLIIRDEASDVSTELFAGGDQLTGRFSALPEFVQIDPDLVILICRFTKADPRCRTNIQRLKTPTQDRAGGIP